MNLSQRQQQHYLIKNAFQRSKKVKVILNFYRKQITYIETIN